MKGTLRDAIWDSIAQCHDVRARLTNENESGAIYQLSLNVMLDREAQNLVNRAAKRRHQTPGAYVRGLAKLGLMACMSDDDDDDTAKDVATPAPKISASAIRISEKIMARHGE